jgi:protein TonB
MASRYGIAFAAAFAAAVMTSAAAYASAGPDYTAPTAAGPQSVKYPTDAQRAGEEGTVVVQVLVTGSGDVHQARLVRSCGIDRLDNAAIESVLGWHFKPAQQNGSPVTGWATVQVVYKVPAEGQGQ